LRWLLSTTAAGPVDLPGFHEQPGNSETGDMIQQVAHGDRIGVRGEPGKNRTGIVVGRPQPARIVTAIAGNCLETEASRDRVSVRIGVRRSTTASP
jgi:hypothetical protein